MHRIGDEFYWEYYDAEISEELFTEFLERSEGFRNNDPKTLLPGELFLVFWQVKVTIKDPKFKRPMFVCALLTPASISNGITDKMTFTNPEYEAHNNSFTLHRGYMNRSWFVRRVI